MTIHARPLRSSFALLLLMLAAYLGVGLYVVLVGREAGR